ncbi:MAG TPA: aldo/keto reductase [Candidatus Binataceae bacterium]|jgi:pyridoxine 4-dehydrogenase|nr:aldo/keto reductase [Candidatus Binataceae bacterium]
MSIDSATPGGIFKIAGELTVARVGYGAMRLTGQPGNWGPYPDWEAGCRLLRRVVELGANFIDTAISYGPGFSEEIIAAALHPYPPNLVIATKGGLRKTGPGQIQAEGCRDGLRQACEASLRRLKVERIDLYQLHRPDPNVDFAQSVEALAELAAAGKIRHVGLSNVTLPQLEQARRIVPIASVQNRFALSYRDNQDVLAYCAREHIAFIPWGPLGARGFQYGAPLAQASGPVGEIAARHRATPGQIALAWLLSRGPNVVVIPGTTSIAHLEENVGAARLQLSAADVAALDAMAAPSA